MCADVILHQLGNQAVCCAAHRHDKLHHLIAIDLRLERSLDRLDLATKTADAIQQLILTANRMAHGIEDPGLYTIGTMVYDLDCPRQKRQSMPVRSNARARLDVPVAIATAVRLKA